MGRESKWNGCIGRVEGGREEKKTGNVLKGAYIEVLTRPSIARLQREGAKQFSAGCNFIGLALTSRGSLVTAALSSSAYSLSISHSLSNTSKEEAKELVASTLIRTAHCVGIRWKVFLWSNGKKYAGRDIGCLRSHLILSSVIIKFGETSPNS